mmetsp:Transcript_95423/g.274848  ORF Transcript_95423/g.274848 Transcript_95423/m.274848 type:complete len:319 (-) Transcript_95423:481-1437(-)
MVRGGRPLHFAGAWRHVGRLLRHLCRWRGGPHPSAPGKRIGLARRFHRGGGLHHGLLLRGTELHGGHAEQPAERAKPVRAPCGRLRDDRWRPRRNGHLGGLPQPRSGRGLRSCRRLPSTLVSAVSRIPHRLGGARRGTLLHGPTGGVVLGRRGCRWLRLRPRMRRRLPMPLPPTAGCGRGRCSPRAGHILGGLSAVGACPVAQRVPRDVRCGLDVHVGLGDGAAYRWRRRAEGRRAGHLRCGALGHRRRAAVHDIRLGQRLWSPLQPRRVGGRGDDRPRRLLMDRGFFFHRVAGRRRGRGGRHGCFDRPARHRQDRSP